MGQTADVALKVLATMDAQDYDELPNWMAADVSMWQAGSEMNGIDDVIAMLKVFYGALPDLEHRVLNVVEGGDTAAVQMNVVATHSGTFASDLGVFDPTGKTTSWFSSTFIVVKDGKAQQLTTYLDLLAVHREFGYEAQPAPA
jgi:ketosteroid isomerase-like protein